MKMKRIIAGILLTAILSLSLTMSGCGAPGGDPVQVTVSDKGTQTTVEGTSEMTVRELLAAGGITVGEKDVVEPSLDKKWSDAKSDAINVMRYAKVTVSCGDFEKQVEMIGGTVDYAVISAGLNLSDYSADADAAAELTDGMVIHLTPHEGVQPVLPTENPGADTTSAEQSAEETTQAAAPAGGQTNTVVGSDEEGYIYVGENGQKEEGYCDGITVDGTDWNVIEGTATKVESESDKILHYALQALAKCTDKTMTREEKLQAGFKYMMESYLEGVRHDPDYTGEDWPIMYAEDIYVYGKGDCFSYGAAFAYMARAIGYTESYACNSGGHGWAEVDNLVYDPEWSMHSDREWYAVSYEEKTEVAYKDAIAANEPWMHVKIDSL